MITSNFLPIVFLYNEIIYSCVDLMYLGRVRLGYSGIRIYSGIYYGYSAPRSRIAGMEIQVFRNANSSQTNAYSHYSNYSYSGLIPNERALSRIRIPLSSKNRKVS